jgi:hypothetical protein
MIINNVPVIFSAKLHLYTDGLFQLQANADNGLRWRIGRKWVSYKQIKKAIYGLQKI